MIDRGSVYLIGSNQGSALKDAIRRIQRTLESRAPGQRPRVAASYAAASADPKSIGFMASMATSLFGGEVDRFTVSGEQGHVSDAEAKQTLDAADVVFLAGGDPVLGAELFAASGGDAWLREARDRGASLLGVSAGAIMLCAWWAKWPDAPPAGAPFAGGTLVPCTRVIEDLVVDCHAEEDDWQELVLVDQMLRDREHTSVADKRCTPKKRGLPHGGGLIVDGHGAFETVGKAPYILA